MSDSVKIRITGDDSEYQKTLSGVGSAAKAAIRGLSLVSGALGSDWSAAGAAMVQSRADAEQLGKSLELMAGSAEKGRQALDQIRSLAAAPLETSKLARGLEQSLAALLERRASLSPKLTAALLDDAAAIAQNLTARLPELTPMIAKGAENMARSVADGLVIRLSDAADFRIVGERIGGDLTEGISGQFEAASSAGAALGARAADGARTAEGAMRAAGERIGGDLTEGISGQFEAASSAGAVLGARAADGAQTAEGAMRAAGERIGGDLTEGISEQSEAASSAGAALGARAADGAQTAEGAMRAAGERIGGDLTEGISGQSEAASSAGAALGARAADGARTAEGAMRAAGKDAGGGFQAGLASKRGQILATAREIADAAASAIRQTLQIRSPSRVTERLGAYAGEGFDLGITRTLTGAVRHARRIAGELNLAPRREFPDFSRAFPGAWPEESEPYNLRPVVLSVNGRRLAETTVSDHRAAQSARSRQIAMGVGK